MQGERLEVRIDPERRTKLRTMADQRKATISEVIRDLIDRAFEDGERAERKRFIKQIIEAEVEEVPDPETLSRQLASTYDIDLP